MTMEAGHIIYIYIHRLSSDLSWNKQRSVKYRITILNLAKLASPDSHFFSLTVPAHLSFHAFKFQYSPLRHFTTLQTIINSTLHHLSKPHII